jgi:hypothetical protein
VTVPNLILILSNYIALLLPTSVLDLFSVTIIKNKILFFDKRAQILNFLEQIFMG